MNPAEAALRLVGPIYEAATDASLWPDVFRQLANEVGGTTTGFMIHDAADPLWSTNVSALVNTDPALTQEYERYYCSINMHAENVPSIEPGAVIWSQEYVADTDLLQSEYYNDFLRRYDLYYLLGCFVTKDERQIVSTYTFRSRAAGPFSKESFQLHELLIPHLRNAAKVHGRLGILQTAWESLDSFSTGIIISDSDGRILQMNGSACRMLEANDGLTGTLGRIAVWNHREQVDLLAMIRNASMAASGNGLTTGGSLFIHRPSGKRPYGLRLRPVRGSSRVLSARRSAVTIIFVVDPETEDCVHPEMLIRVFALTPAEARVALILMNGKSLDECAAELDISIETARTHLKRVLSKTGTKRQGEMIRLLLKSFGHLTVR